MDLLQIIVVRRVERYLASKEQNNANNRHNCESEGHLKYCQRQYASRGMYSTFEFESHPSVLVAADHTCRNMPTTIQIVAVVKKITGNCHVYICAVFGWMRPVFLDLLFLPPDFARRPLIRFNASR
jgi:hypothetical protein